MLHFKLGACCCCCFKSICLLPGQVLVFTTHVSVLQALKAVNGADLGWIQYPFVFVLYRCYTFGQALQYYLCAESVLTHLYVQLLPDLHTSKLQPNRQQFLLIIHVDKICTLF